MLMQKLYNPVVVSLMNSPLHTVLDKSIMVMTVTGRRSGRRFTFPVNYISDDYGVLLVLSHQDRAWWKNLRGGAPVLINLKGQSYTAQAEVFEDAETVRDGVRRIVELSPSFRRFYGIQLDDYGCPQNTAAFEDLAGGKVLVRIFGAVPTVPGEG